MPALTVLLFNKSIYLLFMNYNEKYLNKYTTYEKRKSFIRYAYIISAFNEQKLNSLNYAWLA